MSGEKAAASPEAGEAWRRVAGALDLGVRWIDATPLGGGHIHRTLLARGESAAGPVRVVLQRLNDRVFPDLHQLNENVRRVTEHLQARLAREEVGDARRRCLRLLSDRAGNVSIPDAEGGLWRACAFIEGTRSAATAESPAVAYQVARSFGRFLTRLEGLEGPPLVEVIPGFHDFAGRRRAFEQAVVEDRAGRGARVVREVDALRGAADRLDEALAAAGARDLPHRLTHNDCKIDNVLLDRDSGEGLCVIDLDTVMCGTLAADVGEALRSATCPAAEDERDLSRVRFDVERFDAVVRGFVDGLGGGLRPEETPVLPWAGMLQALENGVRFLGDHLDGDRYFRARRPDHNLDRARVQLVLFEAMWASRGECQARVERLSPSPTPGS